MTYSTFDADSIDVLRLDFVPTAIRVGGRTIDRRKDLESEGYVLDEKARTLTVRHTSSRDVDIPGDSDLVQTSYITFDDPHLPAGSPLIGMYPSGIVNWGNGDWKVGTPFGKFGTFTLTRANPAKATEEFRFYAPRIFVSMDIYNDADSDAQVTFHSPQNRDVSFDIKAKELRRVKTGWRNPTSHVTITFRNGKLLRFDNLGYAHP